MKAVLLITMRLQCYKSSRVLNETLIMLFEEIENVEGERMHFLLSLTSQNTS